MADFDTMKFSRWMVLNDNTVTEVVVRSPNGKRKKRVNKQFVIDALALTADCVVMPVGWTLTLSAALAAAGDDTTTTEG